MRKLIQITLLLDGHYTDEDMPSDERIKDDLMQEIDCASCFTELVDFKVFNIDTEVVTKPEVEVTVN